MQSIVQIMLSNLYMVGILALTTMGLTITYKTANLTNFAQAITSTLGVYLAAYFTMMLGANVWVATLVGVLSCFVIGGLLDIIVLRHAIYGRQIATLGLITLITAMIPVVFGVVPYEFYRFFTGNVDFTLFGMELTITYNSLFTFLVAAAVICLLFAALHFTKWGLGLRATASNKTVAAMMGVNTNRMTAMSWAVASGCGTLAAILYASQTTDVGVAMLSSFVQPFSLLAFVIGGFATFYGPVVGAMMIPIISALAALVNGIWSKVIVYVIVLLIVLVKPQGLFGKTAAKKV